MTAVIHANSSTWGGQPAAGIEVLLQRLAEERLDPRFEAYGNFVSPDAEIPGNVHFFGNFASYSHVFRLSTDDVELVERLTAAIRANQGTEGYAQARAEVERREAYWKAKG